MQGSPSHNFDRVSLKSPPPLAESLSSLSAEGGRLAFRDAVLMCAADGTVDDDEMEALKELAELLFLGDDAINRMLAWVRDGYKWMQAGFELLNEL